MKVALIVPYTENNKGSYNKKIEIDEWTFNAEIIYGRVMLGLIKCPTLILELFSYQMIYTDVICDSILKIKEQDGIK